MKTTSVSLNQNKMITKDYLFNSDPTCRELNGRFYVFATQDPFSVHFRKDNKKFKGMFNYRAYSTVDFDHWVDHGTILNSRDTKWHAGSAVWDGDAGVPANGKYFAYVPFRVNPDEEDNYGFFEIGVLVADRPEGPYVDALGTPMQTPGGQNLKGLSPSAVCDNDGNAYLIWGAGDWVQHHVSIAKLAPCMTRLAEEPREIKVQTRTSGGGLEYYESPILFERNGLWYLTYVAFKDYGGRNWNFAESDPNGCYIQYCTSKCMFGPFDQDPKHLVYGTEVNTQQGIASYKGNWYLAYHRVTTGPTNADEIHRQVCVTGLHFNPDGTLQMIHPETDPGAGTPGVSRLTLDAFAARRDVTDFHERKGAESACGRGRHHFFRMKDGDFLRFNQMDFGAGVEQFNVQVSCDNPRLIEARIEFHIDHPDGAAVGSASIFPTGSTLDFVSIVGEMHGVSGLHDVFLIAHGLAEGPDKNLFNVSCFSFCRAERSSVQSLSSVSLSKGDFNTGST